MKVKDLKGLNDCEESYMLSDKGKLIPFAHRWDSFIDKENESYLDREIKMINIGYDENDEPFIKVVLK